jgi:hypothetical protein
MQRLTNFIPCLLFAAGTFYLISQNYSGGMIFLGGLATFLTGGAAMDSDHA